MVRKEEEDLISVLVAGLIIIMGIALYLGSPPSFHPLAVIFMILGSLLMVVSIQYILYQKIILINEKLNFIRKENDVLHQQIESLLRK